MTVLAYRDGILCSDSLATQNDFKTGYVRKIKKNKHGWLTASCGEMAVAQKYFRWFEDLRSPWDFDGADFEEVGLLLISPKGKTYLKDMDSKAGFFRIKAPYIARASGRDFAMGAMAMGASAREAVAVAIQLCSSCGGEVQEVKL